MSQNKFTVTIDADLEELIPGFLENRRQDLEKMQAAIEAGDYENLRTVGHSLKGVGGGYGFMQITELGAAIESAAREKDMETARKCVTELSEYLEGVEITYE